MKEIIVGDGEPIELITTAEEAHQLVGKALFDALSGEELSLLHKATQAWIEDLIFSYAGADRFLAVAQHAPWTFRIFERDRLYEQRLKEEYDRGLKAGLDEKEGAPF